MVPGPCSLEASPWHHGLRRADIVSSFGMDAPLGRLTRLSHPRTLKFPLCSKSSVPVQSRCRQFHAERLSSRVPLPSRAINRPGILSVRHHERYRDLLVSTNWKDIDIAELRALLTSTSQNCDQFSKFNPDGSLLQVNPVKLQRAIQHSFIVVAMYIRGELEEDYFPDRPEADTNTRPSQKRTLIAFGRATSDRTLTASIHDVAVAPSLQGEGIGRRLMLRLVRDISRHGICDISVMAGRDTRPFFRACGFGSDVLGSTSMMYTAVEDCSDEESRAPALLVPPPLQESWRAKAARSRKNNV